MKKRCHLHKASLKTLASFYAGAKCIHRLAGFATTTTGLLSCLNLI